MVEVTQAEKEAKALDCRAAGNLGTHLCAWCEHEKMGEVVDAIRQRRISGEQATVDRIVAWLRSDQGKGSEEGADWADAFADAIRNGDWK